MKQITSRLPDDLLLRTDDDAGGAGGEIPRNLNRQLGRFRLHQLLIQLNMYWLQQTVPLHSKSLQTLVNQSRAALRWHMRYMNLSPNVAPSKADAQSCDLKDVITFFEFIYRLLFIEIINLGEFRLSL